MSKIQINIINLKCNNVFSLSEACKKVGYKVKIIDDPKVYKKGKADILFLPGVGAFNEAIKTLRKNGFDELIYEHVNKKKLLVGICLGMQLLFNSSSEFKFSRGLGLINGKVTRLKQEKNINFPHVGWKEITRIVDGHPSGDLIVFEMRPENCKFLEKTNGQSNSRAA